ncbi:MAG: hypothetical protein RLZZ360_763 [Candidatus Parcubacteria bacterium]
MIILAVAILILYIKPAVTEIRATQDQIGVYAYELDRVTNVNELVRSHAAAIDALPLSSIQALERYMPVRVDEIAVMRDLQHMVEAIGVKLVALEYTGHEGEESGDALPEVTAPTNQPNTEKFRLSVLTTYDKLKSLLAAIEANNYQLMIQSADITPSDEENLLTVDIILVAYSLESANDESQF